MKHSIILMSNGDENTYAEVELTPDELAAVQKVAAILNRDANRHPDKPWVQIDGR